MGEHGGTWRRIEEDGAEWEARLVSGPQQSDPQEPGSEETLEFVCLSGSRQPRRVAVQAGSFGAMDEASLRRAYRRALPIGGDHYGRPGKRMNDAP